MKGGCSATTLIVMRLCIYFGHRLTSLLVHERCHISKQYAKSGSAFGATYWRMREADWKQQPPSNRGIRFAVSLRWTTLALVLGRMYIVEGGNSAPAVKIAPGACGVWFYLQSRPSFCGTSRHSQARESFLEFDIARRRTGLAGHTILPHRFCVL